MSLWRSNMKARDALAQVDAISKSQAVIEFNMDGTIVTAKQNFLDAMGYNLEEIAGKYHAIFMPREMTSTAAAVEEQSAVTSEMSTGMQCAAAEAASIGHAA